MMNARPDRRWAVSITHYFQGKRCDDTPFLAGRYMFDRYDGVSRIKEDDRPVTATFDTRAAARKRCAWVRYRSPKGNWRTTAKPVLVAVLVQLDEQFAGRGPFVGDTGTELVRCGRVGNELDDCLGCAEPDESLPSFDQEWHYPGWILVCADPATESTS